MSTHQQQCGVILYVNRETDQTGNAFQTWLLVQGVLNGAKTLSQQQWISHIVSVNCSHAARYHEIKLKTCFFFGSRDVLICFKVQCGLKIQYTAEDDEAMDECPIWSPASPSTSSVKKKCVYTTLASSDVRANAFNVAPVCSTYSISLKSAPSFFWSSI